MNVTCVTARYLRYKDPKSYYYTCLLHCLVFKVQEKNKFGDKNGGDERDRTADPLRARQVLSQLSYIPITRD